VIGRLRGTLAEKQPPHLILDVNGLGYELEVPMTTLYRLPSVGEPLTLHTHLVVREDAQLLYGFFGKRERDFFRELIRLNGVGPKLALALMSSLEVDELVRCVQSQDTSALDKRPGVEKQHGQRLAEALQDRLDDQGEDAAARGAQLRQEGVDHVEGAVQVHVDQQRDGVGPRRTHAGPRPVDEHHPTGRREQQVVVAFSSRCLAEERV